MSNEPEHKHDPELLKAALYGDAISDKTEKIGRSLLVVGTMTLFVGAFDIKAKSAALIPLDFSKAPEALGVFLSMATLFLVISYVLRFATDLFNAREEWAKIDIQFELEKVHQATLNAKLADEEMYEHYRSMREDYGPDPEPWDEHLFEVSTEAKNKISKIEIALADKRMPKFLWMTRFMFFGLSPIVVAAFALSHSAQSLSKLFQAIISYG